MSEPTRTDSPAGAGPVRPRPSTAVEPKRAKPRSDLPGRLVTAGVLVPVVAYLVVIDGLWFLGGITALILLGQREFYRLIEDKGAHPLVGFGLVAGAALALIQYLGTDYQANLLMTATLLVVLVAIPFGRTLNILARGPQQAAALGVAVRRIEWLLHLTAALLAAAAVTVAGSIGFVGLIVPHMLRLIIGNDQRVLLPASALAGGILLVLADTLARTLIAPEQLPVGVITALLGVPAFLYLLHRSQP